MYIVEIGSTVVTIRKAKGITQEELAFNANVSIGRLRDVEHGTANYTRDTLYSIAAALGISAWVLYMPYNMENEEILQILNTTRQQFNLNPKKAAVAR